GPSAPRLERDVADVARTVGFTHVVTSQDTAAAPGLLARAETTVADAYLTPLLAAYVRRVAAALPGSALHLMKSSGGLSSAADFRGPDAVLSGPAGGVVACAMLGRAAGVEAVIGLDMGGTSTDVCRTEADVTALPRVFETRVAGVRLRTPMLQVHTIAAGGGSVCRFDGHRLSVGPHSTGARPGPLCYGDPAAHELALTDVALALGRLCRDRFPIPLSSAPVDRALQQLAETVSAAGEPRTPLQLAQGFVDIAVESMADAIHRISVARGHDVRTHALVVFGGAGGQYACAVASRLQIDTLLFHPLAGVLSAYGIGMAPVTWHGEAQLGGRVLSADAMDQAWREARRLASQGAAHLSRAAPDTPASAHRNRVSLGLRYRGTATELDVALAPASTLASLRAAFEAQHQQALGYARPEHSVEVTVTRVDVQTPTAARPQPDDDRGPTGSPVPARYGPMFVDGAMRDVPVYRREDLRPTMALDGPALVTEATATIVIDRGFSATVQPDGVLLARRKARADAALASARDEGRPDPVTLALYANRFMAVAEQMGVVLRRSALSTNIRERLDFSCAVFDPDGGLVANAPHQPVHLGAMGESVKAIAVQHPQPRPGDVFATNDPAAGGSHLPDITVVSPVHIDGRVAFFVASRGHHADVGGMTPGSMPPHSRRLSDEGVVFRGETIVSAGRLAVDRIQAVLASGPHPARAPADNLADLQAQVAANHAGAQALTRLVTRRGEAEVRRYMQHVQDHAAQRVRAAIASLAPGVRRFSDRTDDGVILAVTLTIDGGHLTVDFAGTGDAVEGNTNAPRAVCVAAVLYVLRVLVGTPIPLNRGCLEPVTLHIPEGSLLHPPPDRAVAGGNVETAQRIVDVLLGAFGVKAASQGTMNNLTFGDDTFGYYETLGGGEGATQGHDGRSAVHTHMTNTRITDPEILERRFPVRLHRFAIRRGSGGAGQFAGGDGLIRTLEALTPLQVGVLSDRREHAPFGLHGGQPGKTGHNLWIDAAGTTHALKGRAGRSLRPGERIEVLTPGGGGYGQP
ncbi:MAG: hydantoinase B/oxoprolinase family protein, partial [Myxococcota bacterium]